MVSATDSEGVLATADESRLVGIDDFCALITSRRNLERANDPARGLLGLWDPESRVRYVIDERDVMRGPARGLPSQPR